MKPKILIVDDEKPTRDVMARILSRTYDCLTAADGELALATLEANGDVAVLITDFKMPGIDGVELIRRAKKSNPRIGAILITAFAEIELAVAAMKDGADDFLTKPITDIEQLELRIAKVLKTHDLERQVEDLRGQLESRSQLENFTGTSEAMQRIYRLVRQAAPSNANVLIEGPSGTGKELVARALHTNSPRAKGPFVAVECAALSSSLLESELFGYAPNAFTGAAAKGHAGRFEAADGGTLFLDEIGEIDMSVQVKLLRALESRTIQRVGGSEDIPVDFRLVAATNKNLAALVGEGKFREDLFYRLNVIEIRMPALKDRPGDVALLVSRFLKEFSSSNGNRVTGIAPAALRTLESYDWPGNVRQLRNVVERMVVLATSPILSTDDLPAEISPAVQPQATSLSPRAPSLQPQASSLRAQASDLQPAPQSLAELEKARILQTLADCRYNKTKAAEQLGVSRRTLHRKLKEWGMD